jgi:hypothetical protein
MSCNENYAYNLLQRIQKKKNYTNLTYKNVPITGAQT